MTKQQILAHREVFARSLTDPVREIRVAAKERVAICDWALMHFTDAAPENPSFQRRKLEAAWWELAREEAHRKVEQLYPPDQEDIRKRKLEEFTHMFYRQYAGTA